MKYNVNWENNNQQMQHWDEPVFNELSDKDFEVVNVKRFNKQLHLLLKQTKKWENLSKEVT